MEVKDGYAAYMLSESMVPPETERIVRNQNWFPSFKQLNAWVKEGLMTNEQKEKLIKDYYKV